MKQVRPSITAKEKWATWREDVYESRKKPIEKKWWAKWLKK